jgi:hypothetical protein
LAHRILDGQAAREVLRQLEVANYLDALVRADEDDLRRARADARGLENRG